MVAGARKNVCDVYDWLTQNTCPADVFRSGEYRSGEHFPVRRAKTDSEENTSPEDLNPNNKSRSNGLSEIGVW